MKQIIHSKSFILFFILVIGSNIYSQGRNMTPKQECEELMNQILPFSEEMLNKYGVFFPYGSVMNNDQSIRPVAYYDGNEQPQSQDVINNLKRIYKEYAIKKEIRASAIIWDAKMKSPVTNELIDAVIVSIEHKENYSVQVVFPYKMINGKVSWGEVFAMKGLNDIF